MRATAPTFVLILALSLNVGAIAQPVSEDSPAGSGFVVLDLRIGDRFHFEGEFPVTFLVGAPREITDLIGDSHRSYPIGASIPSSPSTFTDHVSLATHLTERRDTTCAVIREDGCEDISRLHWSYHGIPALLGATALQGRTFNFGDEWVVAPMCPACTRPISIRIMEPAENSPEGTEFRVRIPPFLPWAPSWHNPSGILHMSIDVPVPLRADLGEHTYTLASADRGTTRIPADAPAAGRAVSSSLPFHAVEGRRPHEGDPFPGHPTWHEARASAKEISEPEDHQLLVSRYEYGSTQTKLRAMEAPLFETHEASWSSRYVSDGVETMSTFTRTQLRAGVVAGPYQWSEEQSYVWTNWSPNPGNETTGIWDSVRFVLDTEVLKGFRGFDVLTYADRWDLVVFHERENPPPGSYAAPNIVLNMETGVLISAMVETARLGGV